MKKLEMKEMEVIEGGCPGIYCKHADFGIFGEWAICLNACDGSFLYAEIW